MNCLHPSTGSVSFLAILEVSPISPDRCVTQQPGSYTSLAHATVDAHASKRLRQWLCRKRKVKSGEFARSLVGRLWQDDGLERLKLRTASFASAKA